MVRMTELPSDFFDRPLHEVDPEVADRVLRQLDLRTMSMPD